MQQSRSKTQIIKRLQTERRRLERTLATIPPDRMLEAGVVGQSSVKDVLAHLADWEARMPVWVAAARSGDPVESPDPGLTWKQLDIVNQRIYQAHCHQALDEVLEYFRVTHERFMDMVEAMPEEEMLTCGRYAFTGKAAVYDWLVGFANHDLWGKRKIRVWLRTRSVKKQPTHLRKQSRRLNSAPKTRGIRSRQRASPRPMRGS